MSASKTIKMLSRLLCTALLLGPAVAFADYELNLAPGVTEISQMQYDLHMLVLWICTIAGIGVFSVMIYSIIKHRKSKGAQAAQFHESTTVEVIWTVVPFVILVAIAVPATQGLLALEDSSNPDMNIKVTAIQWKWEYDYIDEKGVRFISQLDNASEDARKLDSGKDVTKVENYLLNVDKPMVVPVNKRVRILLTSKDVIHAWWVPAVGVKRDAIPGFVNESWFKATKVGTYRGQCAELCGKDHGFMPIVLKVVSDADYASWVKEQQASAGASAAEDTKTFTMDELMVRGKAVYDKSCAACHGATGAGIPPMFPAMTGSKIATGDKAGHIDIVANGKTGTAMAAYKSQLSKAEIAAVITYERNAFGNKTGDMVQPSDIK
ncbi:Cytochrome c oxidase polypeptide II [hydrothermal vent metagenome]|uniref:cytochrome-c oxidase n=1 Tax=hydrothermal vent metagenome TaxID=652676 RepID=A0A3B1A206_9ZZZZ